MSSLMDYYRPRPRDPFGSFNSRMTYYAPGPGDRMEGGFETSQPNPQTGKRVPSTLDDVRLGTSPFVTLAGDPSRYGQTVKMGPLTYTSPIDRQSYTLPDVTGYVHDTGSAFKGRPDKLDVAAGDYRGWSPQAASAAVQADAGRRMVTPLEGDEADRAMRPIGMPEPWRATGEGYDQTAVAQGPPPPQGRKMPDSLYDMFQPKGAAGEPIGYGDALANRSNSLIGFGLGLMNQRPGETDALRGYMSGAGLDQRAASERAQLAHQKTQEARQAAMDQFHRAEAVRNQSNLDRAYEGGRVPPGFERGPDGGLRAITGGPADPKYIAQASEGKQKPREFSVSDITKLTEEGGKFSRLGTFSDTFEPRFAGYKAGLIGDAANLAGRNLPEGVVGKDIAEGATWWQGYNDYKNVVRHDLYGGALTPTEVKVFESANITPGMDPAQIQKNLAMQKEVVQNGLRRKANAMIASGYDPKAIAQAYGVDLGEIGVTASGRRGTVTPAAPGPGTAPAPAAAAPAAKSGGQQKTINGKTYTKRDGQWFED